MQVVAASELYRFYHSGDSEVFALRGVSLHCARGEAVAVVGPSGSGKSTLLHLIAGLDEPDGGYVNIAGSRISRRPERVRAQIRAAHIGVLPQAGNLIDHLTVAQNIRLQRRLARKPKGNDDAVFEVTRRLGLAERLAALPAQLSGGEAARAGLAVALAAEPAILLCDEPTAEVDRRTEETLVSELRELRRKGTAIVFATHSPALASFADRIVHLSDGRLVQ